MPADNSIQCLSEVLRVAEGALVGDTSRQIPDPGLGVTLSTGLFLGRALRESTFLTDKEVAVSRPRSVNSRELRDRDVAASNDTILVEFAYILPLSETTEPADQRPARDEAYQLDTRMRGALMADNLWEERDMEIFWVETTERGALSQSANGFGSFEFLVISSTYRIKRQESLQGGSA